MDEWEDTATTIDCALLAMGGSWFKNKWTVGMSLFMNKSRPTILKPQSNPTTQVTGQV